MTDQNQAPLHTAVRTDAAAEAQARIAALRERLMGGRGPGASSQELSEHMHERLTLGAIPTMIERELVTRRTQLARGRNPDALQHQVDQAQAALTATVAQIFERLAPRRAVTRAVQASRRRAESLLGMPEGLRYESGRVPVDAVANNDGHFADPRWWRVLATGTAIGTALGAGVALISRHRRCPPRP